jgi:hypothetical protein
MILAFNIGAVSQTSFYEKFHAGTGPGYAGFSIAAVQERK